MTTTSTNKQHFAILDGMRGIAALGVVIFHFMECAITDYSKNFIGHGFLAVDFFFCLSGFVIGYAYDNRIGQMTVGQFFKLRLIRLHPLVILGSVLGLLSFWFDPFAAHTVVYTAGKLFLLFLCSILLIPMPVMEDRYFNQFGFNAPAWSLFWEYVANIFYAVVLHKVGKRLLILLVALAAVGIGLVAHRATNLMGGWGKDNTWDGGVRVAYSFLAGLLVYRCNWIIKNKLGFIGLSILLSAALLMPFFKYNWLVETLVVLFYFPLLVSLGAGSTLLPRLKKACDFCGNMSYPLYMTHYAGIWIFANYYNTYKPGNGKLALIIITSTTIMVLVAWAVMKWYDTPLRKYLTRKFVRQ